MGNVLARMREDAGGSTPYRPENGNFSMAGNKLVGIEQSKGRVRNIPHIVPFGVAVDVLIENLESDTVTARNIITAIRKTAAKNKKL